MSRSVPKPIMKYIIMAACAGIVLFGVSFIQMRTFLNYDDTSSYSSSFYHYHYFYLYCIIPLAYFLSGVIISHFYRPIKIGFVLLALIVFFIIQQSPQAAVIFDGSSFLYPQKTLWGWESFNNIFIYSFSFFLGSNITKMLVRLRKKAKELEE